MANHILSQILDEARAAKSKGAKFLAVFDLDSTLFDLTFRINKIVDEFALDPLNLRTYAKECEILKTMEIRTEDWGLGEPLSRVGITPSTHDQFVRDLHAYWAHRFFDGEYLRHDEPLPGAVEFVHAIRKEGAEIMYLTGRDIPRMQKGTEQSLRERGFPTSGAGVRVVLKPVAEMDDALFKLDVLKEAQNSFDRIWLFENEPVNLNLIERECPEIGLVFIESTHSGREQLMGKLHRIRHFDIG